MASIDLSSARPIDLGTNVLDHGKSVRLRIRRLFSYRKTGVLDCIQRGFPLLSTNKIQTVNKRNTRPGRQHLLHPHADG